MSEPDTIKESAVAYSIVADSARRLFPNLSLDQAMAELLLERAQKNLIKYQTTQRQFAARYPQGFDSLRASVMHATTTPEQEQDYFDWELAVSGISDMTEEIERLKRLSKSA